MLFPDDRNREPIYSTRSPIIECPECGSSINVEEYRDGNHLICSDYNVCSWKKDYISCTCLRIDCDCSCISGGLDGDGQVTSNKCFSSLCQPHGSDCR